MGAISITRAVPNVPKPERYPWSGSFLAFLEERFPRGFEGQQVEVWLSSDGDEVQIEVDDFDFDVGPKDHVILAITPAGIDPLTIAIIVAINVAISVATYLLTPRPPEFAGNPEPSQVYGAGVAANTSRLGSVVPVVYGRWGRAPELAAISYRRFRDNQEERRFLLLIGAGEFDHATTKVTIGTTPATDLPAGVVTWQMFGPDDHASTIGNIRDATGVYEDVFTCGEVSNQVLKTNSDLTQRARETVFFEADNTPGGNVLFRFDRPPNELGIQLNRNFTIEDAEHLEDPNLPAPDGFYTATQISGLNVTATGASVGGFNEYTGTINGASPDGVTLFTGPFPAQATGRTVDMIEVDYEFQRGLYGTDPDTGQFINKNVLLTFRIENIDTGDTFLRVASATNANRDHLRRSFRFNVPSGRYRVEARRSAEPDTNDEVSEVSWTGLKGYHTPNGNDVYGKVTLMAVTVTSAEEISAGSQQRIQVETTRVIPNRLRKLQGNFVNSPVDVVADIFIDGDYGLGRTRAEVSDDLSVLATQFPDGFNGVFDAETTAFEAMRSVAESFNATVAWRGNKLTLPHDGPRARDMLFTPDNIIPGSLEVGYRVGIIGSEDGIEVEYHDPDTYDRTAVVWPLNALRPIKAFKFGSTDPNEALAFAQRKWTERHVRNAVVSFETEMEGHLIEYGDRLGIVMPEFNWANDSAVITSITDDFFHLDRSIEPGEYFITIKTDEGELLGPFRRDVDAVGTRVTRPNTSGGTIGNGDAWTLRADQGGLLIAFQPRGSDMLIMDITVADGGVTPLGDGLHRIEGHVYDEAVF